jgi:Tol biopolymer transport system component
MTLIPRETFFGNPDKISVSLSPDGKYISYIAPLDGVLNVYVAPSDDLSKARAITNDKGRGIRSYTWSYYPGVILFMQDVDGDENERIFKVDIVTLRQATIIDKKNVKAMIMKISRFKPNQFLFSLNDRNPSYHDVYSHDFATGENKLLLQNDEYVGFVCDKDLNLRLAQKQNPETGEVSIYKNAAGRFKLFTSR